MNELIDVLAWLGIKEHDAIKTLSEITKEIENTPHTFFKDETNVQRYYEAIHRGRVIAELILERMDELENMRQQAKESPQ